MTTTENPPIEKKPISILALIPAYNEELSIGSVVLLSRKYADAVIVIDDGSSDNTAEIARSAGAEVITVQHGGKAAAMMAGFARARMLHPKAAVMLDGDGQHKAEEICKVAQPVLVGVADLVVGSRFLSDEGEKDIQGYRKLGQHVLNKATNMSASVKCSDSQSGFRALSPAALLACDFASEGYNLESDMLAHFAEAGLRITEVPITVAYDAPNMHKMNPVRQGLTVLSGIFQLFTVKHPLICFGVPGTVLFVVGLILAFDAISVAANTGEWATTLTLLAGLLLIMGMLLWSVAMILYSLAKIVRGRK